MVSMELNSLCIEPFREKHGEAILERIKAHPEEARQESDDGTLPLHNLVKNDPPIHIVKALAEAYPEALFEANDMDYMPLHVACRYGCNPEVVEYLITKNPQAVDRRAKADNFDFNVTHIVRFFGSGQDVVTCEDMIRALPEDHPNRNALLELIQNYSNN